MARLRWACVLLVAAGYFSGAGLRAEMLPADREKINAVDAALHKVSAAYRAKKYTEVGTLVTQIEQQLEELKASEGRAESASMVASLELRLEAAQRLVKHGAEVAMAAAEKKPAGKPAMPRPNAAAAKNAKAATGVSFTKQVAPVLVAQCARCHIDRNSGGFSVATYADLMKGSPAGRVFTPGKGAGSTLIDMLESGDMPRGGNRMSDLDITMIQKWIDEGAKFDGSDPTGLIAGGSPMQMASAAGGSMSTAPTGKEKVHFMRDVAPILVGHCVDCHGGDQGAQNYELDTFRKLLSPGQGGEPLAAGRPEASLLLNMVKGTAKDRLGKERPKMPRNRSPLTADEIKTLETWIAEGAKFDGEDEDELLAFAVAAQRAYALPHEQLAKERAALAKRDWNKGNPGVPFETVELDDVVVYGNVPPAKLREIAEQVADVRKRVAHVLKLTGDTPVVKGKLSIFIFEKRFEYVEFTRMVERRDVTSDNQGHFYYNIVDAFGATVAPKEGDPNFALLIAEQLCGAHVASAGRRVPTWFAVGAGRALAAKVEPRAGMIKQWNEAAAAATRTAKPGALLTKTPDSETMALAHAAAGNLVNNAAKFSAMLDALHKGTDFDVALQQIYGMNAQTITGADPNARNRRGR